MRTYIRWLIIGAAALALAGCGGDGGVGAGAGAPPPAVGGAQPLSGTAAIGAPLPRAQVTLTDANGQILTVQADDMGRFTFPDVRGLTAPVMLRATGTAGGRQHVLFSASTTLVPTLNVTPLTTAVVEMVLPGTASAATVFDNFGGHAQQLAELSAAKLRVTEALRAVLVSLQLALDTNPFTTPFDADGTGLDQLLDLVDFIEYTAHELMIVEKSNRANRASLMKMGDVAGLLMAPSAVGLDTSGIHRLIDRLNSWTDPQQSIRKLIDNNFLHFGMDVTYFLDDLASEKMTVGAINWAIDGCKVVGGVSICNISFNLRESYAGIDVVHRGVEYIQVIQRSQGGEWLFYGNQAPFDFEFDPLLYQEGGGPSFSLLGVHIELPDGKLLLSEDGGRNFSINRELQLTPEGCRAVPWESGAAPTGGMTQCWGWIMPVLDQEARRLNDLIDRGLLFAKIVVQTAAGAQEYHIFPVRTPFFTSADFMGPKLRVSGLGTAILSLTGSAVDGIEELYITASVFIGGGAAAAAGASWDAFDLRQHPLNGRISMAAANSACDWYWGGGHMGCDATFLDPAASFTSASVIAWDEFGRILWLREFLQP